MTTKAEVMRLAIQLLDEAETHVQRARAAVKEFNLLVDPGTVTLGKAIVATPDSIETLRGTILFLVRLTENGTISFETRKEARTLITKIQQIRTGPR